MLGTEFESRVDEIVSRYPHAESAILPVLWEIQKERGWVDLDAERWVAGRLGISEAHVHGVVTFYTMFKQQPSGKYHIQICTTLSCMLRGSDELLKHLEKKLGIKAGETTPDGKFSIVRVECLGACGYAPMFQLNDDYHENLSLETVDRLIESLP